MTDEAPSSPQPASALREALLKTGSSVQALQQRAAAELAAMRRSLDEQAQELAASHSLLAATLEATPGGIVVFDRAGAVVAFNSKLIHLWRLPVQLVHRGRAAALHARMAQQVVDAEAFLQRSAALVDEPQPECSETVELLDGRSFERISTAQRGDGGWVGVAMHWRDVTEQRRAAASLRAQEAAQRASRAKTEFIGRISHELRTPLNAILGFSELLQMDPQQPLPRLQAVHVERIRNAGGHLLRLIGDLLDVSRIESGALRMELDAVDALPLLGEALDELRDAAARRELRLAVDAGGIGCAWVRADRTRLKQVLLNLLSNAVKYNRRGGDVRVRVTRAGERTALAVVDTGPGLSAAQLAGLFQPFNRLGAERSGIEGTGIGLVISKHLVEQMGGALQAHSQPGLGSEFCVDLPSAEPPAPAAAPAAAAPTMLRGKVLYIDDDEVNRLLMQAYFQLWPGLDLALAVDAGGGVAAAFDKRPALVLIDMHLPDGDGLGVLKALRAAGAAVPCIAVSANAMDDDIRGAIAGGFDAYLTKPVSAQGLQTLLERFLGAPAQRT